LQIAELEQIIEAKSQLAKSVLDPFALNLEKESFRGQLQFLQSLLKQEYLKRDKEVIKLRLKGSSAKYGNLPLEFVGGLTTSFSDAIFQSSKYLQYGNKSGAKIQRDVKQTIDVRLEDIMQGSTILLVSGKTSPDLFGYSLIEDTLDFAFDLFDSNEDTFLENVTKIGVNSIKHYSSFVKELLEDELEIEIKWNTPSEKERIWDGKKANLKWLYENLNKIKITEPEEIEFSGKFITISSKGYFEIETLEKKRYRVKFPNEFLSKMQEFHIDDRCEGTIIETVILNTTGGKERAQYNLKKIDKV